MFRWEDPCEFRLAGVGMFIRRTDDMLIEEKTRPLSVI
jgi:hypothetical protein